MIKYDIVKNELLQYGYTLLEIEQRKVHIVDKEHYHYKVFLQDIKHDKIPRKFCASNPYVIDNIRNYITINNIKSQPLFTEYKNNSEKLKWKCGCGDEFTVSWGHFLQGKCQCNDCGLKNGKNKTHNKTWSNAIKTLESDGYIVLDFVTLSKIHVQDKNGYKYCMNFSNYKKGFLPQKFSVYNPYTIHNLNRFFELKRNSEYICLSSEYKGNYVPMKFIHLSCNTEFTSTLSYMTGKINSIGKFSCGCPKCVNYRVESYHASILKQVFMHEYPDTICEDRTCVNPNTGYVLPTDIVNHNLKIVIEVQSGYHDIQDKKLNDIFKRKFWENLGYTVYTPDIREYNVLEMIQLFFPKYDCIPDYIDYNYGNMCDYKLIQSYLNEGKSISQITQLTPYSKSCIQGLINRKLIILPVDYKEKAYKIKKIVQLDKNYNYIATFNSYTDLDKHGYANGTIRRVLNGKQKYSYDCIWMYENDYKQLKIS